MFREVLDEGVRAALLCADVDHQKQVVAHGSAQGRSNRSSSIFSRLMKIQSGDLLRRGSDTGYWLCPSVAWLPRRAFQCAGNAFTAANLVTCCLVVSLLILRAVAAILTCM